MLSDGLLFGKPKDMRDIELDELRSKCKLIEEQNSNLKNEVIRLTGIISAKTETCQVGPWCEGCVYQGTSSYISGFEDKAEHPYVTNESGRLIYCRKYLSEICPEYTPPYKPSLSYTTYRAQRLEEEL